MTHTAGPGFDRVARAYRWLEYLTFGRALEHCRLAQMERMLSAQSALVLGDGDGRFTAALLAVNARVRVLAIDSSPAMLALLAKRVRRLGASERLRIVEGDAVGLLGCGKGFDLVVSHFFLDCLSTAEVEQLAAGVLRRVTPEALWVVSEFATPSLWTRLVVGLLYRGFSVLTGLRARELPAYEAALATQGFVRIAEREWLRGLLRSTVWQAPGREVPAPGALAGGLGASAEIRN